MVCSVFKLATGEVVPVDFVGVACEPCELSFVSGVAEDEKDVGYIHYRNCSS